MIVIQGHFDSAFVVDPMLSEFTMNPTKVYPPQLLQKSNCVCREQHLCHEFFDIQVGYYQREQRSSTVCSEGFLYKVAPPELKNSTIMYFVILNSVMLSKILKIVVPYEQNFEN